MSCPFNCRNVGPADRLLRLVLGAGLLALGFAKLGAIEGGLWGVIAAAAGAVLAITGAVGMCPLYIPLKVSTCRANTN